MALTHPTSTIVWLRGEHDASTADGLKARLARAAGTCERGDLVVDLSGVEFMSSATLNVLLDARKRLALCSRSLTLRRPSPRAARVLEVCHTPTR